MKNTQISKSGQVLDYIKHKQMFGKPTTSKRILSSFLGRVTYGHFT